MPDRFVLGNPMIGSNYILSKRKIPTAGIVLLSAFLISVLGAVIGRYFFDYGSAKLDDLQHYTFSLLTLIGIFYAFSTGNHVRITSRYSETHNHVFEQLWLIAGATIPFTLLLIASIKPILLAWQNLEGSAEPGGLPGYFLVKTALPIFCAAIIYIALKRLRNN